MNLDLKDKVYFLAGGSEGIGLGIAKILAEEGATLYLGSRDPHKLQEAEALLAPSGIKVKSGQLDVSEADSISNWVTQGIKQFGRADGLLINAGGPPAGHFEDLSEEQWQKGFNLTLMSAVRLMQSLLPHLKKQESSSIVAITSSSIKEPIDELLLSSVFRSGVTSLLKSVSRDFASFGIRVNNIVPGRFNTSRITELNELVAKRSGKTLETVRKESVSDIPMQRYGEVEEIGRAAAFLFSPVSSYITGETLIVDGGMIRTVW